MKRDQVKIFSTEKSFYWVRFRGLVTSGAVVPGSRPSVDTPNTFRSDIIIYEPQGNESCS